MVIHVTKMRQIWLRPRTTQSTRWVTYYIENAVAMVRIYLFKNANKKLYNLIIQLQSIKGYSHKCVTWPPFILSNDDAEKVAK